MTMETNPAVENYERDRYTWISRILIECEKTVGRFWSVQILNPYTTDCIRNSCK